MIPKLTCFEFELRGQVGTLCGIAHIATRGHEHWQITGISLYGFAPGAPLRRIDRDSNPEEVERIERAVTRQCGDRINHIVAALFGHELARAS